MKLFEVDLGSARIVLKVLKGLADRQGGRGEIPYAALLNKLKPYDLPIGGLNSDRQQMIVALKNAIPDLGAIINDVKPDGTIVLDKTNEPADQIKKTGGSSIDKMASSNTDLTPNI